MAIFFKNTILSEDDSLYSIKDFDKIIEVLKNLEKTGTLERMTGNCIGACEMLGIYLQELGIKSYTAETPVLIDISIGYTLPSNHPTVVERLNGGDSLES
jgi:hypothetical protein